MALKNKIQVLLYMQHDKSPDTKWISGLIGSTTDHYNQESLRSSEIRPPEQHLSGVGFGNCLVLRSFLCPMLVT